MGTFLPAESGMKGMKKILVSLSIIGAVAAIATGVTIALFNDTETSTGNILVAGTMDLKVDHLFASYNGSPCTENCVEDTNTNLIQNGSFEFPEVTDAAKWQIFADGTPNLMWTVEWEGGFANYGGYPRPEPALTEYHENVLGPAQHGDQYAELDSDWFGPSSPVSGEPALVRIYQNVATTPGTQYKLHYWYSPRPKVGAANNVLKVRINGSEVASHSADGGGTTSWTEYTYTFVATGNSTKIEFAGAGPADSLGTFLDSVKLHPFTCTYQINGGTCTLWDEKDLGPNDYYWHYGPDMKPGDWGRNVISLHAYSNDAYACIITNNIINNENDLIEPETNAGDITPDIGELSQFIKLFAWEDTTQNNVYDVGEPIISALNTPLNVAIGRISLTVSITKYIGIDWCFGAQSLNGNIVSCSGAGNQDISQTDTMNASITAYAEQQRNNPNFNCANVVLQP